MNAQAEYENAEQLFQHGYLDKSEQEAAVGYRRFLSSNPDSAARFQLLEAEIMLWRGMDEQALNVLAIASPKINNKGDIVRERTLEGLALLRLHRFPEANQRLWDADRLCSGQAFSICGGVIRARAVLAFEQGRFADAHELLLDTLSFARAHHDPFSEATALLNLSAVSIQEDHFDEALDWSKSAHQVSVALGSQDLAQGALGNVAFAYLKLGDNEKALPLFLEAKDNAIKLGDPRDEIKWLDSLGYIYRNTGDLAGAYQSDLRALESAKRIKSVEDIVNSLEDLAHISIQLGKLDEAKSYIDQVNPLIQASGNHLDAMDVLLAQGKIASARHKDEQAEAMFRMVAKDPGSQTSRKLASEHELALLYERQGNKSDADRMYRTALASFESARDQLKKEDSEIPFVTNAADIYDDYIQFLIGQGKTDLALRIADESRAQTLEHGLGVVSNTHSIQIPGLNPTNIAAKTNATLLFYWLSNKQSYLWAINSKKISLFPVPSQREIKQSIDRYSKAMLGIGDPVTQSDPDGISLYRTLVAPAAAMLPPNSNVTILCDGVLSQLNFETLIVPGTQPHYWIEDATVVTAPSLHLLASATSAKPSGKTLLLIGDAVSPNADYPELPEATAEMREIQQDFNTQNETVYARERASSAAYLSSSPQQFAYIHFVAHGVASRTDPLDSAIILSRSTAAEDSFKLHAREIIQHPIHAHLVTISACYGSGTRSYAGEGLVGLAWAFLRAGAHNVIGALWEVSDESTPKLMGELYKGLNRGLQPREALRQAKLSLLHSQKEFRKPFYWAPFQIYTGR